MKTHRNNCIEEEFQWVIAFNEHYRKGGDSPALLLFPSFYLQAISRKQLLHASKHFQSNYHTIFIMNSVFRLLHILLYFQVSSLLAQEVLKGTDPQKLTDKFSSQSPKYNEFNIDAFDLALYSAIELSYERISPKNIGYGCSVLVNFHTTVDYHQVFAWTPFLRLYLLNPPRFKGYGFYTELFIKAVSGTFYDISKIRENTSDYFDVGLGLGLGYKWNPFNKYTVTISLGVGRPLVYNTNSPDLIQRGGLAIGYRF